MQIRLRTRLYIVADPTGCMVSEACQMLYRAGETQKTSPEDNHGYVCGNTDIRLKTTEWESSVAREVPGWRRASCGEGYNSHNFNQIPSSEKIHLAMRGKPFSAYINKELLNVWTCYISYNRVQLVYWDALLYSYLEVNWTHKGVQRYLYSLQKLNSCT